jgi:hypothetical protein
LRAGVRRWRLRSSGGGRRGSLASDCLTSEERRQPLLPSVCGRRVTTSGAGHLLSPRVDASSHSVPSPAPHLERPARRPGHHEALRALEAAQRSRRRDVRNCGTRVRRRSRVGGTSRTRASAASTTCCRSALRNLRPPEPGTSGRLSPRGRRRSAARGAAAGQRPAARCLTASLRRRVATSGTR